MNTDDRDDIIFEQHFYEALLDRDPNYVEAMVPLAEIYTELGLYEQGLTLDLRLTREYSDDESVWYNLACSLSLFLRVDESLVALRKSIELGWDDFEFMDDDPDLINLRRTAGYIHLKASLLLE